MPVAQQIYRLLVLYKKFPNISTIHRLESQNERKLIMSQKIHLENETKSKGLKLKPQTKVQAFIFLQLLL